MKYYVVWADWAVDYQSGHKIVGVFTNEDDAKVAFKKRVEMDDRILALQSGYEISVDNDKCFEAGKPGFYIGDHLTVMIEEVSM